MGIERVPPPCALFPPSSSLPFFRLLSAVFAAAFCCLWPLLDAIASMAPFVFMSSSINPCLREACYSLPPSLFSPSPFLSLSSTCMFMSKRRFIIFGRRPKQCNAKKKAKKENGRQRETERGACEEGGRSKLRTGVRHKSCCGTAACRIP